MITQPQFKAEELNQIFLHNKPLVDNILSELFGETAPGSLIQIDGGGDSGKTILLMDLMSKTIAQKGKENLPEVLFIDLERKFNISKFVELMCHSRLECCDEDEFSQLLDKLSVITCNHQDFTHAIDELDRLLNNNPLISLVAVDSLILYYSEAHKISQKQDTDKVNFNKESYLSSFIKKFKHLGDKYKVTFIYTVPDLDFGYQDDSTTHFVSLSKTKDRHLMKIKTKDGEKRISFEIDIGGFDYTALE